MQHQGFLCKRNVMTRVRYGRLRSFRQLPPPLHLSTIHQLVPPLSTHSLQRSTLESMLTVATRQGVPAHN